MGALAASRKVDLLRRWGSDRGVLAWPRDSHVIGGHVMDECVSTSQPHAISRDCVIPPTTAVHIRTVRDC
eukprot:2596066-Rhodomonas_salina.4